MARKSLRWAGGSARCLVGREAEAEGCRWWGRRLLAEITKTVLQSATVGHHGRPVTEAQGRVGSLREATTSAVDDLLLGLIQQRVLISGLHAPSTVMNALGHLVDQLDAVDAADLPQVADQVRRLKEISRELERHNHAASAEEARTARTALAERITKLSGSPRPLAVDLRLDCELALPPQIEREAEAAASALARLTAHPFGAETWQRYHARFFERYGIGTLVPILELVNPGVGLGFPDGYPGSPGEQRSPLSRRDERLTELAQTSALDGQRELVLDDAAIAEIAGSDETGARWPADLEICFRILASSENA